MKTRRRIYLAGPIRGCNDEQKNGWRREIRDRMGRYFEIVDPAVLLGNATAIPSEIALMRACDIVLANMWKESIGTTIGVVRAGQLGKPIVLLTPESSTHAILDTLVLPDRPVHTIDDACKRLNGLVRELETPIMVRWDSNEVAFDARQLTASIIQAVAAANLRDIGVEVRICRPVIDTLSDLGRRNHGLTPQDIQRVVSERLSALAQHWDESFPKALREDAGRILEEWRRLTESRNAADAIANERAIAKAAADEVEQWKRSYRELEARALLDQRVSGPSILARSFRDAREVLEAIKGKWPQELILHEVAFATAEKLASDYSSEALDMLYVLLDELGRFVRRHVHAKAGTAPHPTLEDTFQSRYAATEWGATKRKYRTEVFTHDRRNYRAYQHLKDSDSRRTPIRVYFDEIPGGRMLICWIGHRPTVGYSG